MTLQIQKCEGLTQIEQIQSVTLGAVCFLLQLLIGQLGPVDLIGIFTVLWSSTYLECVVEHMNTMLPLLLSTVLLQLVTIRSGSLLQYSLIIDIFQ